MVILKKATTSTDFDLGKQLFKAYAEELDIDLSFQHFSHELDSIEQQYGPPDGVLYLLLEDGINAIGCFGIRKLESQICELKRMYIKKNYRGKGFSKMLLNQAIETGQRLGYEKMRLDTLPSMQAAIHSYQRFGFYEIPSYRFNPIEGTKYFEKALWKESGAISKACQ